MNNFKLRPPTSEDTNFIFNSWLKSYRSSDFAKAQCNEVFFSNYKKIVNAIINRSMVTMICSKEDDNHLFGYAVFEHLPSDNLLLHYIYIKHTYRKSGFAKHLIEQVRRSSNPILVSHITNVCKSSKSIIYVYDPYQALYSIDS